MLVVVPPSHARAMPSSSPSRPSPYRPSSTTEFLARLHALLSMASRFGNVVGWTSCGTAWTINSWTQFRSVVLPLLVGGSTQAHSVLFFDLTNHWGFQQQWQSNEDGVYSEERGVVAFYHECFLRDFPCLLGALKPAAPVLQHERFQPISTDATTFYSTSHPALRSSTPTHRAADMLQKSMVVPTGTGTTTRYRLFPTAVVTEPVYSSAAASSASLANDYTVQAKPSLNYSSAATSTRPPPSREAQQPVVTVESKNQQACPSWLIYGSATARQIRTTATSLPQLGSISQASSSAASKPPANRKRESPLPPDKDLLDKKKTKKTKGERRKWLPSLGPPVAAVASNTITTSNSRTNDHVAPWFCTNPETFADY
jgi:HSF-type DNA-binding